MSFKLESPFKPTGDQPQAIEQLVAGLEQHKKHQTLLGVTGSGKTFTAAQVIQKVQKPTLIIAHNKTLAAQLYQEFRDFFPENAVSYFVSYYDYYQPEAYIPTTDTYIEKEAMINDEIDKLRLSTTANLLTRPDVIVIASVSCIYNLGSPIEYGKYVLELIEGQMLRRQDLLLRLMDLQYERSTTELRRGTFVLRGDTIQLWPAYVDKVLRIDTLEDRITKIDWTEPMTGQVLPPEYQSESAIRYVIYPAKHFMINPKSQSQGIEEIKRDLDLRVAQLEDQGKKLEAYRLKQKVTYDLEMLQEFGFVNGIENYSRYFDGRGPGDAPGTLLDYFRECERKFKTDGFLTIIDESHMTVPQIRGMYNGDQARKETLINYGFRLPSALDNRPLRFPEFLNRNDQTIYVSATPNEWEVSMSQGEVVEQLIRPTGLVDPKVEIRPVSNQIEDLIKEVIKRRQQGQRSLVTTLTKKMAEALTEYLNNHHKIDQLMDWDKDQTPIYPKVAYLHSDIDTLERSDILDDLRGGVYDVVVGINLLREGLDLPEVTLVAILDADKEGFLRSSTALIQTIGRAARHQDGRAILYADKITKSMKQAIEETERRRQIQLEYNREHNITPQSIAKPIRDRMIEKKEDNDPGKSNHRDRNKPRKKLDKDPLLSVDPDSLTPFEKKDLTKKLNQKMRQAADNLDFELAAQVRDKIRELEN